MSALTIAADAADGALVVSADESAPQGTFDLTVVGENPSGVTTAETKISFLLRGKAGTLDPTFGTGGIGATFDFRPGSAVLDQSGRMVIVGTRSSADGKTSDFVVARVGLDGRPDPTFGTGGMISRDFSDYDTGTDVVIAPDSKILVAGYIGATAIYNERAVVLRFNADGSTDTSFGVSGRATLSLQAGSFYRIALQPDGKILAAGSSETDDLQAQAGTLARFTAAGTLDPGFGTDGVVRSTLATGSARQEFLNAMLFDASGVLVGGMYSSLNGQYYDMTSYVGKYTALGTPDSTFGSAGRTELSPGLTAQWSDYVSDLARTSDNMVFALATHTTGSYPDAQASTVLARMSLSGALDPAFGKNGLLTLPPGPTGYLAGGNLALQADGKLVFTAATESNPDGSALYLARRMPDGSPDGSFGVDGMAPDASLGKIAYAGRPLLQSDGKIILVHAPTYTSTAVARFWN